MSPILVIEVQNPARVFSITVQAIIVGRRKKSAGGNLSLDSNGRTYKRDLGWEERGEGVYRQPLGWGRTPTKRLLVSCGSKRSGTPW